MIENNKNDIEKKPYGKLVTLLKTLDEKEKRKFAKFLDSSYFNNNDNLKSIYKLFRSALKKEAKLYELETTNQLIFNKIISKSTNVDDTIHDLKSKLTTLLCEFLVIEEFKKRPIEKDMMLLDTLHARGLENQTNNLRDRIQTNIDKESVVDLNRYYWQHRLSYKSYFNHCESRYGDKGENIGKAIQAFLTYTRFQHYEYAYEMKVRSTTQGEQVIEDFLKMIEEDYDNDMYGEHFMFTIYHQALNLLQSKKNVEAYWGFKKKASEGLQKLKNGDDGALLTIWINIANDLLEGTQKYEELFFIYKYGLDNQFFIKNGIIDPNNFSNIVTIANGLEKYDWLENEFLPRCKEKLLEGREHCYKIAQAEIAFCKKEWEKAEKFLMEINTRLEFAQHLRFKVLLVKIYYELNSKVLLHAEIARFRTYLINNSQATEEYKPHYPNFLTIVKKLNAVNPSSLEDLQKIRIKMDEMKVKGERIFKESWINEKLEELEV